MDEHPSFSPLPHIIHLPSVVLSPSGLDLAEDMWVKRLARALGNDYPRLTSPMVFEQSTVGINHAPAFSRSTTHLLCPGATGAKYTRARAWGTPVVDTNWLSHIARAGALPPPEMFLVSDSRVPSADMRHTIICTSSASHGPQNTDLL